MNRTHRAARPMVDRRIGYGSLLIAAVAGSTAAMIPSPAHAQRQVQTSYEIGGARLSVTSREMGALVELSQALGRPPGAQDAALANARRVARGPDARYALALYQLEIGRQRKDSALRAEALDILIASDLSNPDKLAGYLGERGSMAYELKDWKTAKRLWTRLLEIKPDDPEVLSGLAGIYQAENEPGAAADLLERAAAAREATGAPASEILYRQRLSIANQGKLVSAGTAAAHSLVRDYPNSRNWRDALVVYRQLVAPTGAAEIDLMRLMRATGTLSRADEYQRMAQLLNQAGLAAEARSVLAEGLSRGLLQAGESPTREIIAEIDRSLLQEKPRLKELERNGIGSAAQRLKLADALAGAQRYPEAIALYRGALADTGVDASEVNVRLGRAHVLAGQSGHAEAAFSSAANSSRPGVYADLARFWLAWLSPRSAAPTTSLARAPVDPRTAAGAPPHVERGQAARPIIVTGRRAQPEAEDEPEADDKVVCRVEKATRSRLVSGRTCRTVAEWRIETEREQDYARDVAEEAHRRDRRPRRQ